MKVVWRPQARAELAAIVDRIGAESPAGAARVHAQVLYSIGFLADWPDIGRSGSRGYRELVVPHTPYLVIYKHDDVGIKIMRVRHASRKPLKP